MFDLKSLHLQNARPGLPSARDKARQLAARDRADKASLQGLRAMAARGDHVAGRAADTLQAGLIARGALADQAALAGAMERRARLNGAGSNGRA